MKAAFHTLGCKLNFAETGAISKQFKSHDFEIVSFDTPADVCVINTCTVTDSANKECRQVIRRALRKNPYAYIIVTGCYAQLKPQEIASIGGVDLVLGSNEKFNLFDFKSSFIKESLPSVFVTPSDEINSFGSPFSDAPELSGSDERTRAFFKVQDGCDYKCTFCTIPKARGKSRSLPPDELITQFNRLIKMGYKEIVLTGVNIGDYGKHFDKNLYDLLILMTKQDGDFRIRISSIEPNLLTDQIIALAKENSKICNHFHIPLQSGSDKILKLMHRRYLSSDYSDLIHKLVNKIPDVAIGVDVITGLPGETYDDFIESYNFIKELPVAYLHAFTYSEREDTKAASMADSVPPAERKKRTNMLRILSEKKKNLFYSKMIGKQVKVLYESEHHDGDTKYIKGFSSNYIRVKRLYESGLENTFDHVKLEYVDSGEYLITKTDLGIKNSVET